jgi:hypothetical protein
MVKKRGKKQARCEDIPLPIFSNFEHAMENAFDM